MQTEKITHGLYGLFIERLKKLRSKNTEKIIPFPKVFGGICPNFSISKRKCWELLFLSREMGIIEIIPFKGIINSIL